jgi:hypothetical protein
MQTTTVNLLLKSAPVALPLSLLGAMGTGAAAGALAAAQKYTRVAGRFEEPLQRVLTIAGAALMLVATRAVFEAEHEGLDDERWYGVSDLSQSN